MIKMESVKNDNATWKHNNNHPQSNYSYLLPMKMNEVNKYPQLETEQQTMATLKQTKK